MSSSSLSSLSDADLVLRLPVLVGVERSAMADVIEHLSEMERRRLYLAHATSSLYRYCIDRLGYAEDAALKRHRVALLALRLPQVLAELRAGSVHLTALFLLSKHLTAENAALLLGQARGKSRRQLEELIARSFPRPDVAPSLSLVTAAGALGTCPGAGSLDARARLGLTAAAALRGTCPGAGSLDARARLEPLSASRLRVEFTARAEVYDKLERARELLSHALPSGDLGALFERALDALLEQETRRRFGAGRPRKARKREEGSRHVPVEIARAVWERDGARCTFVDTEERRCGERRFVTLEHRHPYALGGPPSVDNLCLLCCAHNLASARAVFGKQQITGRIRARAQARNAGELGRLRPIDADTANSNDVADTASFDRAATADTGDAAPPHASLAAHASGDAAPPHASLAVHASVLSALCQLGFRQSEAVAALGRVCAGEPRLAVEQLLRKSLRLLVPAAS